jgi:hypothetical protein
VTEAQLIATTPEAPWLPPGSSAEVWVGEGCAAAEPVIIVRLLLTRRNASDSAEFFCVPTARGLDLPTRFLGVDSERERASDGLARLVHEVLGLSEVATRCVGYVRNVVPAPDGEYPHPTPRAHVPVFVPVTADAQPVMDGEWVALDRGRTELEARHWWPIVEHYLTTIAS